METSWSWEGKTPTDARRHPVFRGLLCSAQTAAMRSRQRSSTVIPVSASPTRSVCVDIVLQGARFHELANCAELPIDGMHDFSYFRE